MARRALGAHERLQPPRAAIGGRGISRWVIFSGARSSRRLRRARADVSTAPSKRVEGGRGTKSWRSRFGVPLSRSRRLRLASGRIAGASRDAPGSGRPGSRDRRDTPWRCLATRCTSRQFMFVSSSAFISSTAAVSCHALTIFSSCRIQHARARLSGVALHMDGLRPAHGGDLLLDDLGEGAVNRRAAPRSRRALVEDSREHRFRRGAPPAASRHARRRSPRELLARLPEIRIARGIRHDLRGGERLRAPRAAPRGTLPRARNIVTGDEDARVHCSSSPLERALLTQQAHFVDALFL